MAQVSPRMRNFAKRASGFSSNIEMNGFGHESQEGKGIE
jgi:hypothetical protein